MGTAEREGVRFIVVILKAPPGRGRFDVSGGLLEAAYARQPRWVEVARPGLVVEPVPADTSETAIRASAWGTLRLLLEDGRAGSWRLRPLAQEGVVDRPGWKRAVGYLDYRLDGRTVATLPAHSPRVD